MDVYAIVDLLAADAVLDINAEAAELVYRSHYAGGHALKTTLPEQHPVLWPEHFDVSATENEVTYGISAGDSYHPTPYAYRGSVDCATGPFWNTPFGVCSHSIRPTMSTSSRTALSISSPVADGSCDRR